MPKYSTKSNYSRGARIRNDPITRPRHAAPAPVSHRPDIQRWLAAAARGDAGGSAPRTPTISAETRGIRQNQAEVARMHSVALQEQERPVTRSARSFPRAPNAGSRVPEPVEEEVEVKIEEADSEDVPSGQDCPSVAPTEPDVEQRRTFATPSVTPTEPDEGPSKTGTEVEVELQAGLDPELLALEEMRSRGAAQIGSRVRVPFFRQEPRAIRSVNAPYHPSQPTHPLPVPSASTQPIRRPLRRSHRGTPTRGQTSTSGSQAVRPSRGVASSNGRDRNSMLTPVRINPAPRPLERGNHGEGRMPGEDALRPYPLPHFQNPRHALPSPSPAPFQPAIPAPAVQPRRSRRLRNLPPSPTPPLPTRKRRRHQ